MWLLGHVTLDRSLVKTGIVTSAGSRNQARSCLEAPSSCGLKKERKHLFDGGGDGVGKNQDCGEGSTAELLVRPCGLETVSAGVHHSTPSHGFRIDARDLVIPTFQGC